MSQEDSVSVWIGQLKEGDRAALDKLWKRYFRRLVHLARKKLQGDMRVVRDEEDIALSAFAAFHKQVEKGAFPNLEDRDDLWQILVMLTNHKIVDYVNWQTAKKRDYRKAQLKAGGEHASEEPIVIGLISQEPDPAFAAELSEQYRYLFDQLGEDRYREVARLKLEGYTNQEIAEKINRAVSTVEYRLRIIRKCWQQAAQSKPSES